MTRIPRKDVQAALADAKPVRSSGRMRPRRHGSRYRLAVTIADGTILVSELGDLTVHEAMRRAARAATADGHTVIGVAGVRLSPKTRRRSTARTLPDPIDWDAVTAGRHGLSHRPNR